ncbi:MAG: hypothetical protein ACR2JP_04500 [Acidimicrobiia bacterium]
MRLVEFLGVPGSGKSTLVGVVEIGSAAGGVPVARLDGVARDAMARTGRDPLSRVVANSVGRWSPAVWKKAFARSSDRMAVLCRAIVAHPQLATAVIEANEAHNGDARPDLVMGMMFNHLVAFRLAEETMAPDAWLLLDEGLCNRVTSLFAADFDPERDRRELVRYLDLIPVPDVLVVVSTPIDLCFVRLESIGWTERIRDKRPEQRRAFLERSALLVELTGEHMGARGAQVVAVDGTADVALGTAATVRTVRRASGLPDAPGSVIEG